MTNWLNPVELAGTHVKLVPLAQTHADDLQLAAKDGELHRLWYTGVPKPTDISARIDQYLVQQDGGTMVPFAVIHLPSDKCVGITTYMNIDQVHRRVEIGSTWYAKSVQRSPLNTECKLLLLSHAFEKLDAIAVEFRTHFMNQQSRRAIERLGAKLDGVLRNHSVLPNGTVRDTAAYSIIPGEWPSVKANLQWKLDMPRD